MSGVAGVMVVQVLQPWGPRSMVGAPFSIQPTFHKGPIGPRTPKKGSSGLLRVPRKSLKGFIAFMEEFDFSLFLSRYELMPSLLGVWHMGCSTASHCLPSRLFRLDAEVGARPCASFLVLGPSYSPSFALAGSLHQGPVNSPFLKMRGALDPANQPDPTDLTAATTTVTPTATSTNPSELSWHCNCLRLGGIWAIGIV